MRLAQLSVHHLIAGGLQVHDGGLHVVHEDGHVVEPLPMLLDEAVQVALFVQWLQQLHLHGVGQLEHGGADVQRQVVAPHHELPAEHISEQRHRGLN